jgi:hypothetical protein
MNKKNIRVRKGQVQKSCRAMIFVRDFLTSSRSRPLAPRLVRSSASNHRVGRLYTAWPYPKHLSGRAYGLVVHGDVAGIEGVRRALSDWLDWMGMIDAGTQSRLDRYIGYYKPYATSHDELDQDQDVQEEVRNVARAVAVAVRELRAGK